MEDLGTWEWQAMGPQRVRMMSAGPVSAPRCVSYYRGLQNPKACRDSHQDWVGSDPRTAFARDTSTAAAVREAGAGSSTCCGRFRHTDCVRARHEHSSCRVGRQARAPAQVVQTFHLVFIGTAMWLHPCVRSHPVCYKQCRI